MISGYVNINQIIYEACERLGISNSEAYEMRFLRLILDAETKIGTGLITSKKIKLYEPGSDSFKDSQKLLIPHELVSHLIVEDSEENKIKNCGYSIIGNRIVFNCIQTKPVILKYIGIHFDINDQPVISQNHFEAVVSYLVYMETTTRYHSRKSPYYEFKDAREWWQDRLGEARGNDSFPSVDEIKESANELYSVKTMCLKNGEINCSECGNDILIEYERLSKVFYGVLSLSDSIDIAEDYTSNILNPETESTKNFLSSDDFIFNTDKIGRLVFILPYESGLINSMKDSANNNIFEGYFNIIKDEVRQITIYVAKNFVIIGNYKLTIGFSN